MTRWYRHRRNVVTRPAVILLYHRVTNLATDPQSLAVTPTHFAEHLQILRERYAPASLSEIAENAPRNGVAVTFDDGYADNLHEALPLLRKFEIPATFFITTGQIGKTDEFWWDELERLVLLAGQDAQRDSLYRQLCDAVRPLPPEARDRVIAGLREWASDIEPARPTHRALTRAEIATLASDAQVEIGAHTVSHPQLSSLDPARQAEEIDDSKRDLESIIGRPVSSFSYPFGDRIHYADETVSLVKAAGFQCACSNFSGWIDGRVDPFQLPRVLVRDWDGPTFARELDRVRFGSR